MNNIRTFLTSYKVTPPHTGLAVQESDFFSIKGVGISQNTENTYFSQQINSSSIFLFYVYSPIKIWVSDVTINANYSISIDISSLTNDDLAFINIINTDASSVNLLYKQTLIYNDLNLFPGMQEYVKSTILNIK